MSIQVKGHRRGKTIVKAYSRTKLQQKMKQAMRLESILYAKLPDKGRPFQFGARGIRSTQRYKKVLKIKVKISKLLFG
jgi:hypothetical protein